MAYGFIKRYLRRQGYSVYPHEMICGPVGCPHERNRFVDVVARKKRDYYAFEYKSAGDYLMRALQQVENYRLSFDYVTVVAEVPRHDVSVHPTRGVDIRKFFRLGIGLWTVEFMSKRPDPDFPGLITIKTNPQFTVICEPKRQSPVPQNHEWIKQKFLRYRSSLKVLKIPPHPHQRKMEEFAIKRVKASTRE